VLLDVPRRRRLVDGLQHVRALAGIAARVGVAASTVSRELARNADPKTGHYLPARADRLAWERQRRPKPSKLARHLALWQEVQEMLEKRYSPEQAAGRLKVLHPDHPAGWVQSRDDLPVPCTCTRTGHQIPDPAFTEDGDLGAARALVESAEQAEFFLYVGGQHLFADASLRLSGTALPPARRRQKQKVTSSYTVGTLAMCLRRELSADRRGVSGTAPASGRSSRPRAR
jgi:hypothetical protein